MSKQSIITGEVLLLCERVEMAQFMHAYLRHLFKQGISLPNMQLENYLRNEKIDLLTSRHIQLEGSIARTFSFPAKKLLNVGKRVILRICCCSRCGGKARSGVIIIICII